MDQINLRNTPIGQAIQVNNLVVQKERELMQIVENNRISALYIIGLFLLGITGVGIGGAYIHECTAKKDDTINYGLYGFTTAMITLSTVCIAWTSYMFGKKNLETISFRLIVGGAILLILFAQIGVVNALATPNDPQWNEAGLWSGGIVLAMGLFFIAMGAWHIRKNWKLGKREKKAAEEQRSKEALQGGADGTLPRPLTRQEGSRNLVNGRPRSSAVSDKSGGRI
jgi:hypothetical protein